VTFGHPLLLLVLLALPLVAAGWWLVQRRRARYAVRFTNVDVLASILPPRSWRRHVAPALFLLSLAALCVAVARPHVTKGVASDKAAVILVLDVSGSMQAQDVKPTRLAAAQKALHTFLDKAPKRLRIGLVLFAGEAQVATPPTADHALVGQAVDDAGMLESFGGTAIGDALATAVKLGQEITGSGTTAAPARRSLAALRVAAAKTPSTLVSILFLSDGHQTRGVLRPLQGAAVARKAGIPVYTVALGTKGGKITNFSFGGSFVFPGGQRLRRALEPDPRTLHAIAAQTGGRFYDARSAGAVKDAYSRLGSSLGRAPGSAEVTNEFEIGAAVLLLLAVGLGALWAPKLP